MRLTLQRKLVPTPEQHTALLNTMRALNAAASYAAQVGFAAHVFTQQSIHRRCYREWRGRFGLSAQMAVRAIGKAVGHCQSNAFRGNHQAVRWERGSVLGLYAAMARPVISRQIWNRCLIS
jgi:predicted transposase